MLRAIVILVLLVVGLGGLALAAISATLKLIGAVFWIALAALAYWLWSRSRRSA